MFYVTTDIWHLNFFASLFLFKSRFQIQINPGSGSPKTSGWTANQMHDLYHGGVHQMKFLWDVIGCDFSVNPQKRKYSVIIGATELPDPNKYYLCQKGRTFAVWECLIGDVWHCCAQRADGIRRQLAWRE